MTVERKWKARELEILQLMAKGLSNGEIGSKLHLAPETVRWYNKHIFEKLEASNRTQAVARATELGLLAEPGNFAVAKPVPPLRSPVRYVANRGVHIAYQVIGQGPVDLLFIHGFLSHLELAWQNTEFANFFEQLGLCARVILFDKRGMGLSDRIQGAPTIENTIEDACCVLDAVASERAIVMGTSEGGAAAALLASTYPERVLGLILYAALPKAVQTNGEPDWADPEMQFEQMLEEMQDNWGGAWALESFAPSRAHNPQFREWWSMVLRAAASPSSIKAVLANMRDLDIRPLLPQIRTRTLVLHKTHDRIASVAAGRYFADHLPNATWIELAGADHIYFIESAALLSAIERFCQAQPAPMADTWIAIIVCVLTTVDRHAVEAQLQMSAYRPRHSTLGARQVIALFDSPTRAVECARSLQGTNAARALQIGLHVGECSVKDGKPADAVLHMARHTAETSPPGEIAVTRTLHDILAGTEFDFQARDETAYLLTARNPRQP